jgi:DoxX-like family
VAVSNSRRCLTDNQTPWNTDAGGAAIVISAPRLPLIKEWAYAGSFFLWSGAVTSQLAARDGLESWWVPLMLATFAVASWVLRPADRRLPETRLRRDRPADAGPDGAGPPEARPRAWETRPRAWAVSIGLLVVLHAFSLLTLPAVEDIMHDQAVDLGWIDE